MVSPYEAIEKRVPDLQLLFVHVFGCPVSFKPMKKTVGWSKNKNGQIAVEGWFVGMVWPRVLVLRKCDMKVVAVSRKKVVCYESIYCLPPHEMPIKTNWYQLMIGNMTTRTIIFLSRLTQ